MPRRLWPIVKASFVHLLSSLIFSALLLAQEPPAKQDVPAQANPERQHALELYSQGRMVDAMPLLEKLAADNPKDMPVAESLGMSMLSYAQTIKDSELKKKARVRARSVL